MRNCQQCDEHERWQKRRVADKQQSDIESPDTTEVEKAEQNLTFPGH